MLSDIRIIVSVDTDNGKKRITVTDHDIEELVEKKASDLGIQGRAGMLFRHLSPTIVSISAGDLYEPPQDKGEG